MKQNFSNIPDKCCNRCHFLEKWERSSGSKTCFAVSTEERQRLLAGNEWNTNSHVPWSLACNKGVWDSANFRKDSNCDLHTITTEDRGESCFFYPRTPGMFFPAADELEERVANRREAERDRALTRHTLWVAIAALIVSILATTWAYFHPL